MTVERNSSNGAFVKCEVLGKTVEFLIDTGASVTILNRTVFEKVEVNLKPTLENAGFSLNVANAQRIHPLGLGEMSLRFNLNSKYVYPGYGGCIPHKNEWVGYVKYIPSINLDGNIFVVHILSLSSFM